MVDDKSRLTPSRTWSRRRFLRATAVLGAAGLLAQSTTAAVAGSQLPRCGLDRHVLPSRPAESDPFFTHLFDTQGPGWTGGDSTYSLALPDGRVLWMFSDTFLGTVNPDGSRPADSPLINNSLVVQDGTRLVTLHGGTPSHPEAFFVPQDGSSWYWVYDGTVEGDRVVIFLLKFHRYGPGMWDWRWVGTDAASLALPDLHLVATRPVPADNGVAYGAAVLEEVDHTYIYGVEDLGAVKYAHLARAPRGDVLGRWQFFAGDGWSWDPRDSARLLPASVANEFSVTKIRGGYLLVTMDTSPDLFLEGWREIVAYFACRPEGPWRDRTTLYVTPEAGSGRLFTYNAHAHPEFTRGGGLLISYNVNSFDFQDLFRNVDNYRPRFVRAYLPGVSRRW